MFTEFKESTDMEELAEKLVKKYEILSFVNIEEILFLQETKSIPKALARCYRFGDHPIMFFTNKLYAIVFYELLCGYMTKAQRALLMYHELRHIGKPFNRLNDHTVKDFDEILAINVHWSKRGAKIPNILKGENAWAPAISQ